MSRLFVVPLALALLVVAIPAQATDPPGQYLVGYTPGHEDDVVLALKLSGATVKRTSSDLHFAVVVTDRPTALRELDLANPYIEYVEDDGAALPSGAQWNGAQWNGAQWNGAQWNGAQWNGAQWNGAQWNDADLKNVSDAQRLAAKWTEKHYQSDATNKMKWAGNATDPGIVWQWAPWATDANHAWTAGRTGTRSATLCVLDSGVAWDHKDIAPNHVASYNAMSPGKSAYDDGGHGTHVAGIAAGALANSYGVAGVANVQIISAKVLDSEGAGRESDLAFGLAWCANQDTEVAVMALSATDADHPTLQRALAYAASRDVLLVASAGNTGGAVAFPANDPRVVAVAAVDGDLKPASFSARGADIEIAAPGVHVLGPLPGGAFAFGSGTSQAAAYAAGAAAALRDHQPGLTAEQARAKLAASAADLGSAGRDDATGAGLVDVRAALA